MNIIVPFGSQREIEAHADKYLSSFNGRESEFDGDDYIGYDDDFLEFEGNANSFANEVQTGRRFTVQLDNTQAGDAPAIAASSNKNVIIFPSFSPNLQQGTVITDGANNIQGDKNAPQAVNVIGIPETLLSLQKWIERNPVRCLGMKIESTNVLQMGKYITISPKSPFRKLESENIYIQDYKTEMQYNDKVATIMRPFQIDNQTDIIFQLAQNSVTTITFYFGAALNTAKALRKKSNAANAVLGPIQHRL